MNGVTSCGHRCGACKRSWVHELIDQGPCLIALKALCPKCHARLAEWEGQASLFAVPKEREEPEQLALL